MSDFNQQIIEEFRANAGKVGGSFEDNTILILHTVGAKSGQERIHPLAYQPAGSSWAVFASKGGAPTNPDWYHNLLAHLDAVIEVGSETIPVRARVATGAERDTIWEQQKSAFPGFAEYEQKAGREIPVVILERRA